MNTTNPKLMRNVQIMHYPNPACPPIETSRTRPSLGLLVRSENENLPSWNQVPILHKLQTSRKVHPTSSVNHICSESDYLYQVSVLCRELPPFYHLVCPCLFFQVNSEFYVGWFDPWGEKHAHTDAVWSTNSLIRLMKFSARVNVNMWVVQLAC